MKNNLILDTNIVIDAQRGVVSAVSFLDSLEEINISTPTYFEILKGAQNKRQLDKILQWSNIFNIVLLNEDISKKATEIYIACKLRNNIDIFDSLIAASALYYNFTLATRNVKHFSIIKELKVYKPY